MSEYRHEYKYICSFLQLMEIQERLKPYMHLDPAAGETGEYTVRSLYFDDYDDHCLRENMDGTDPREKFRIRIYNGSISHAKLELKQKKRGMTRKLSCPVPPEQLQDILGGNRLHFQKGKASPLLQKFILEKHTRRLSPRIIVEYDRIPYVHRDGNVRLTLDLDIRSTSQTESFSAPILPARLLMPTRLHVLEVKFDDFLPDHLYQAIGIPGLTRTSFSKYALCRLNTDK